MSSKCQKLHILNTSHYSFRHLLQVKSTYYNDSLLLMRHCTEKVYITGLLLVIIHFVIGVRTLQHFIKVWALGQWVQYIFKCGHTHSGFRMAWDSCDLLLQSQGPYLWRVNYHSLLLDLVCLTWHGEERPDIDQNSLH